MKESVLRTIVPIVYALLLKIGFDKIGVDDAVLQDLATLVAAGLLYVALRVGERYKKEVGWLLGYAKQPVYVKGEVVRKKMEAIKPVVTAVTRETAVQVPSTAQVQGRHRAPG